MSGLQVFRCGLLSESSDTFVRGSREAYLPTKCSKAGPSTRIPPPHVYPSWAINRSFSSASWACPVVGLIERVSDRGSFQRLARHGRRVRSGVVRITFLPEPQGQRRVAYALSRRVGNAVVRNRIRRRLRSVFTHLDATDFDAFRHGTYLVTAHREAATMPYGELAAAVTTALETLAKRRAT